MYPRFTLTNCVGNCSRLVFICERVKGLELADDESAVDEAGEALRKDPKNGAGSKKRTRMNITESERR